MKKTVDLSFTLSAASLEKEPLNFSVCATEKERENLVERFDLVSLDALSAEVRVQNKGSDNGVLIAGHLNAILVQRCTITLEDVPETLDVDFDVLLVDPEMAAMLDESENYLDPDAPDYDALEGDIIEIGEIVAQTLSVWMEPYPRAPSASVAVPDNSKVTVNEPELERPNPFAGLAKLSDKS